MIVEYSETHPNVHFHISNNIDVLEIDSFDFIVDESSELYNGLESFLLSKEEICIKDSKNHPFANKTITFSHLHDQPFIIAGKGSAMHRLLEHTCNKNGFAPNVTIECNDRSCLLRCVEANMGLALGSRRSLKDTAQRNIIPLTVTDFHATQSVYVFHRKFDASNAVMKNFCEFLYQKRLVV